MDRQIYKVHKRFCGQNPFKWPVLTEKEVKAAWERRNLPRSSDSTTWMDVVTGNYDTAELKVVDTEDRAGCEAYWQVKQFASFSILLKSSMLTRPNFPQLSFENLSDPESPPTALHQSLLVGARSLSLSTKYVEISDLDESAARTEAARLFSKDPIEHMSYDIRYFDAKFPAKSKLSSDCHHRLVILYSILAAQLESKLDQVIKLDWKQDSHIQHAISAVESSTCVKDSSEVKEIVSDMIDNALSVWEP